MRKMHFVGIDVGSTSTKLIALSINADIIGRVVILSGAGTRADEKAVEELYGASGLEKIACRGIVATGYGRNIFAGADKQVSEITCHARGLKFFLPEVRTIIDVGGQDLKAIRVNANGGIEQFVMNDKCAAGTGRFLEVMSKVMCIDISELGEYDAQSTEIQVISNTCTVFAESEVISKLSAGVGTANIVAGIHDSVARKIVGLVSRIGVKPEVTLTGGGALNAGLVRATERHLKCGLKLPADPQITGALGAALIALETYKPTDEKASV